MTYPQVWSNAAVRALPIGRLGERALWNVLLGRRQFFRAGPWVPLEEDDSRLLRVSSAPEPLWAGAELDPPEPAAAELLFASHPLSRPAPGQHEPVTASRAAAQTTRGSMARRPVLVGGGRVREFGHDRGAAHPSSEPSSMAEW